MDEVKKLRNVEDRPSDPFADDPVGTDTPPPTLNENSRDAWSQEPRGGRKVPKKLQQINQVMVSSRGPLLFTGNIRLVDEAGQETWHNNLRLCRCGATNTRPHCDNTHADIEFVHNGRMEEMSMTYPTRTPQTLTLKCMKQGPLRYQGYLRIHNNHGQEYISMGGLLCRCGRSSRKPFCDCI